MKCSKCGYLGFEEVDRCRNCGFDFSFSDVDAAGAPGSPSGEPELSLRPAASTPHPLDDLALLDAAAARPKGPRFSDAGPDLDRMFGAPETEPPAADALPLSGSAMSDRAPAASITNDDEPLITRASPPRAPLAVRRSTPEVPRLRAELPRFATLDLESEPLRVPPMAPSVAHVEAAGSPAAEEPEGQAAEVGARVLAGAIDLLVLAAIDVVVIYFTLQVCGIGAAELSVLPKAPLVGFLLVQNIGYLIAFTAGGQTLGKMAAGIRVVPANADSVLDLGHAALRTFIWIGLAIPAGLGFLTALIGPDHRGLHDRLAGTRVVR